jgi:hypothetical protein
MTEKSYVIEETPSPPMSWEEYKQLVLKEWDELLTSTDPLPEDEFQKFFERHPCMLPGAFGILGVSSGHGPFPSAVISQAVLPSYDYRKPDFMWIATDSETVRPIPIEIERPEKRWFTKSGKQTEAFTEAHDQLAEWKNWFSKPHNEEAFKEFYRIPRELLLIHTFKPFYVLIYGRREEATKDNSLAAKRAHLSREDEEIMTYDRIEPEPKSDQFICVSIDEKGYRAVNIPPTFKTGPTFAKDRALIKGKKEAIQANQYLSPERKDFLVRRIDYWDEWSKEKRGVTLTHAGDSE